LSVQEEDLANDLLKSGLLATKSASLLPLLVVPISFVLLLFGGGILAIGATGQGDSSTATSTTSTSSGGGAPSAYAKQLIPANVLAMEQLPTVKAQCPGLSWTVIAAITHLESGDGKNAVSSSAGAQGWNQFLPSTWDRQGLDVVSVTPGGKVPDGQGYGVDGDGDGLADIHNPYDSMPAAARYLCANGGGTPAGLPNAVFQYNHAWWYVNGGITDTGSLTIGVLPLAAMLADPVILGSSAGGWHVPLEGKFVIYQPYTWAGSSGHPGDDLEDVSGAVFFGRPILAAHDGIVIDHPPDPGGCGIYVHLDNGSGITTDYCHMSALAPSIAPGANVSAGQVIGYAGSTGDSTGPHLHFQIKINGVFTNPFTFMLDHGINLTNYGG
jgi:murein DD-endopeptidase MepM/ murein hydrolase activator NlpD